MIKEQRLFVFDLEGVLFPEIWPAVAAAFALPELTATTRDFPDYDLLMRHRLACLESSSLGLSDLLSVIAGLDALPGAVELLDRLRATAPVLILSDTFEQFLPPVSAKLHYPSVLCHRLILREDRIIGYKLRLPDQKRAAVEAFQRLNYSVIAIGDSFNDLSMLHAADTGFLVDPPESIREAHPIFPVSGSVRDLAEHLYRLLPGV
jgi:phosphoserine/homoserine phosphotransferase